MDNGLLELIDMCEDAEKVSFIPEKMARITELKVLGFSGIADRLMNEESKKEKLHRIGEEGYIKITDQKIGDFLDRKVLAYNKTHKKKETLLDQATFDRVTGHTYMSTRDMMGTPGAIYPMDYSISERANAYQQRMYEDSMRIAMMPHMIYNEWHTKEHAADMHSISRETCDRMRSEGIGQYIWKENRLADYKDIPPRKVLDVLKSVLSLQIFDYFTIAEVNEVKDPLLLGRLTDCKDRYYLAQWGDDVTLDDLI